MRFLRIAVGRLGREFSTVQPAQMETTQKTAKMIFHDVMSNPARKRFGFGKKAAIVNVDLQKAYTSGEFKTSYMTDPKQIDYVNELSMLARSLSLPVVWTHVAYMESAADAGVWGTRTNTPDSLQNIKLGSTRSEFDDRLEIDSNDTIYLKKMPSCWHETPLQSLLIYHGVDTVILTGGSTSGCIRASAVDSLSRGYRTIVPIECVADKHESYHFANLTDLSLKYADVLPVAEVLAFLKGSQPLAPQGGAKATAEAFDSATSLGANRFFSTAAQAAENKSSTQRKLPSTQSGTLGEGLSPKVGEGGNGFIALTPPAEALVAGPIRDLEGYAWEYPDPKWPNGAKLAMNLVVNFEEGSESSFHHGDNFTESVLTDGARSFGTGVRNIGAESLFEYGSRVGFWRIMKMFEERNLPVTMYSCAMAFEMLPKSAAYVRKHSDRIDICCHGWRWWPQHNMPEEVEREHIRLAVESLRKTVGVTDTEHLGWYGRYAPSVNSRRLLHEAGFKYDSDSYCDDMPYWDTVEGKPHLVIPYSIQNNDAHLAYGSMPGHADAFFENIKNSIDTLMEEGRAGVPKMMSVGLHQRTIGHTKFAPGLKKLLDYIQSFGDEIWVTKRSDISKHWWKNNPGDLRPR